MKIVLVFTALLLAGCAMREHMQPDFAKAIPCDKDNCGKLPPTWNE
jgi:hypothetical protein